MNWKSRGSPSPLCSTTSYLHILCCLSLIITRMTLLQTATSGRHMNGSCRKGFDCCKLSLTCHCRGLQIHCLKNLRCLLIFFFLSPPFCRRSRDNSIRNQGNHLCALSNSNTYHFTRTDIKKRCNFQNLQPTMNSTCSRNLPSDIAVEGQIGCSSSQSLYVNGPYPALELVWSQ